MKIKLFYQAIILTQLIISCTNTPKVADYIVESQKAAAPFRLIEQEKYKEAISELHEMLAKDSQNTMLYNGIGLAHLNSGNPRLAKSWLRKSLIIDSSCENSMCLLLLARINIGAGEFDEAKVMINRLKPCDSLEAKNLATYIDTQASP
jgi:tetratricopeptide (TPR) repeat protein